MSEMNPADFGRVGVLMGGESAEREISLRSGNAVLTALRESGIDAVGIDTGRSLQADLEREKVERAFIMLHGGMGEDGTVQAVLGMIGMPYTGSGVLSCALAMDKVKCKQVWLAENLPTPAFAVLGDSTDMQRVIDELGPVFVKPVHEGSSIGIRQAASGEGLARAYEYAKEFDRRVIAEQWIKGPEFSVSIVGDRQLPVIELKTGGEFYDYHAKYESGETQYICPGSLGPEKTAEIQQLAMRAYRALDCSGWGRVDLMQDASGAFWLLEVNTIPGMTSHSLVPMSALEAGMSFNALVVEILKSSGSARDGMRDERS